MFNSSPTRQLATLRERIIARFNLEEVRTLVYDLGVNYDDLRGEIISTKTQALLEHLERHGRIPELMRLLKERHPGEDWERILASLPETSPPRNLPADQVKSQKDVAPAIIQQEAGEQAVQIGQNFGQVIVQHPQKQFLWMIVAGAVLVLALFFLIRFIFPEPATTPLSVNGQAPGSPLAASPTPSREAVRQLTAVNLPALANVHLMDIAVSGGTVWLGAQEGLFVFSEGETDARRVVNGIVTAVAAHGHHAVWFSLIKEGEVQFGSYQLDSDQVAWLTAYIPLNSAGFISAMVSNGRDQVWLGDSNGNIYSFEAKKIIGQQLPPPATIPIDQTYSLALAADAPDTVWVVGSSAIYRWQSDQWVTIVPPGKIPYEVVNAVAGGTGQRAWFGHAAGLTLFQEGTNVDVRQECTVPHLPSTLITDLAAAKEGQELWLVSRGGLAWLDARAEATPPDNCAAWRWQTWTEDGFWQPATAPGVFRLAVDEDETGKAIVWVIRQDTGRIRRLE